MATGQVKTEVLKHLRRLIGRIQILLKILGKKEEFIMTQMKLVYWNLYPKCKIKDILMNRLRL